MICGHNHRGDPITLIDKDERGNWVIDGGLGKKKYWAWRSKIEAMQMYRDEYWELWRSRRPI